MHDPDGLAQRLGLPAQEPPGQVTDGHEPEDDAGDDQPQLPGAQAEEHVETISERGALARSGPPPLTRFGPLHTLIEEMASPAQLTRLGLTTYEAKAYLALVRRDSSTAAQVARLAGVPRQRIYDVLATLVEKGLASTRPGQVVKYAAIARRARARAARLRPARAARRPRARDARR